MVETDYSDVAQLAAALAGHDAAVSVLGPAAIAHETTLVDASAAAAGVKRFIVNDFGWGQNPRSYPEMREVGARRHIAWDRAKEKAEADPGFTWTGITIGNPIDWVCASRFFSFLFLFFRAPLLLPTKPTRCLVYIAPNDRQ